MKEKHSIGENKKLKKKFFFSNYKYKSPFLSHQLTPNN